MMSICDWIRTRRIGARQRAADAVVFRRDTVVLPRYRRGRISTTTGTGPADRPLASPTRSLRPEGSRPDAEPRVIDLDRVVPVPARDPRQFAHLTEFADLIDEWLKPRR